MGFVKLAEALKYSRGRKAIMSINTAKSGDLPALDNIPAIASDYGIEIQFSLHVTVIKAWSEMEPSMRRALLLSEEWEPIDQKPVMLVLAEAASDWSIHEYEDNDDEDTPPFVAEGYNV